MGDAVVRTLLTWWTMLNELTRRRSEEQKLACDAV